MEGCAEGRRLVMVAPIHLTGTAVRAVACALPASLLVVLAGLMWLVGLLPGEKRRTYIRETLPQVIELAKVIVGIAQVRPEDPSTVQPPPVRSLPPPRQEAG
jgi:hypothetical protein